MILYGTQRDTGEIERDGGRVQITSREPDRNDEISRNEDKHEDSWTYQGARLGSARLR